MRRLVTLAAAALTLGILGASPALADAYGQGHYGQGNYNQNQQYQQPQHQQPQYDDHDDDDAYQGQGSYGGRNVVRRFDFNRHEGGFDRWERGFGNQGLGEYRHHKPLSHWRLVRRIEQQGYYGVRGLRKSAFGFGWRAFAFTYRGRPVMLRINPYNGRVLNARYV